MFLDVQNGWSPPGPWLPNPPQARLTKRGERVVMWIVAFNLLMLVFGPLAGVTLFDAVAAAFR